MIDTLLSPESERNRASVGEAAVAVGLGIVDIVASVYVGAVRTLYIEQYRGVWRCVAYVDG